MALKCSLIVLYIDIIFFSQIDFEYFKTMLARQVSVGMNEYVTTENII